MNRPVVIMLNSATLDGKIAVSPDKLLLYGDERWQAVEGSSDFSVFEWLKAAHHPGAILEGSGSFVRQDEKPAPLAPFDGAAAPLYQDFLPEAVVLRPGHKGWFTVVDGRGRIRWTYTHEFPDDAWQGWRLLVLACEQTPAAYLAYLQMEEVPYIVAGQEHVDLGLALERMKAQLGVECVLSTAGGRLNGALLRSGLVDEINIEVLPAVIGGYDTPCLFASPDLKADEWPVRLNLVSAQVQTGGRVWLRYRVASQAAP